MEEIKKIITEICLPTFEKGSVHWVNVTSITDPHNFYVVPRSYKIQTLLKTLLSMKPPVRVDSVHIDDMVVFNAGFLSGVEKYLRGKIINIIENEKFIDCDILAIDYGYKIKSVPLENIWKYDEVLTNLPPLALLCMLVKYSTLQPQIDYRGYSANNIELFKSFITKEPVRMDVLGKENGKLLVALISSKSDDIVTLMASQEYTTISSGSEPISWKPYANQRGLQYKLKEFEVGQQLHVRMLSGKSLEEFHVATIKDYKRYLKEVDIMTGYAKSEQILLDNDYSEGVPVCVKNERGIYERAFIKKVNMPNALVHLVDLGKDEEFPINNLQYISELCIKPPVLAIFCSIKENKFCELDLDSFLTPGFEFLITIKGLGYEFECPYIVDIFPLENLDGGKTSLT